MARGRNIGNVYAELSVKDKMTVGIKRARASLNSFGSSALRVGTVAVAAVSAAMVVGSKRIIKTGADLDHLSTQTGVAVASLMKLGQAYKDNGKDASGLGKDIGKMQKAIFDAATYAPTGINYFEELGLSAGALSRLTPEEQFFAIGNAIKSIEDPTRRAATAMGIFGRSGASLITVFEKSNLEDVNKSLGRMPEIMDKFSGALERADTLMGRLPNKADQFFTGFTAGIIGQLLPGLEAANEKDFTTLGENLGKAISKGLELLQSGDIWEIFGLQGQKALQGLRSSEGMNSFAAFLNTVWDGVTNKEGFDYDEYFEKYKSAGVFANEEILMGLQDRIDEILDKNAASAEAKSAAAAAYKTEPSAFDPLKMEGAEAFGQSSKIIAQGVPMLADMMAAVSRGLMMQYDDAIEEERKIGDFQAQAYDVNEMQRRGLGMGGEGIAAKANKEVELLQQIRDLIRNAPDRDMVWN